MARSVRLLALLALLAVAHASIPRTAKQFTSGQKVSYRRRKLTDDPTGGYENLRVHAEFIDAQIGE